MIFKLILRIRDFFFRICLNFILYLPFLSDLLTLHFIFLSERISLALNFIHPSRNPFLSTFFSFKLLQLNLVYMPFETYTNLPVTQVRKRVKKIRYVKTESRNYGGNICLQILMTSNKQKRTSVSVYYHGTPDVIMTSCHDEL